jgi:hypothetical protein
MKNLLSPLWLALVLTCGFTGCAAPAYVTAGLGIEVTAIERTSDGAVRVTWRMANPNVAAYVLARSTHKLTLNGTLVGTLADSARLGLPPQSTAERSAVLTPANAAAAAVVEQAVAQGSATYKLDSTVFLLIEEDKHDKIPFTSSGTVPVTAK